MPHAPGKPDIAEASATFELHSTQIESDGLGGQIVVEETGLAFDADQAFGQTAGRELTLGIEFAELGNGLLTHFAADANRPVR